VAGSRENHGFHAVVQNGPAASELSLPMRKTASWSGSLRPTEYKVAARMFVRDKRAPLEPRHPDHNERAAVLGAVKVWPGIAGA
jgi:hypothetical protein